MARQNVIGGGWSTTRTPRRSGTFDPVGEALNRAATAPNRDEELQAAAQGKARAQLEAIALQQHPGDLDAAAAWFRSVAEPLGLIPAKTTPTTTSTEGAQA